VAARLQLADRVPAVAWGAGLVCMDVPAVKSGDRVFYKGEPVWVITWLNARHREGDAWVLIQYGDGQRRYVRGRDLEPDRETA
jgi:hypothetical protein